MMAAEAVQARKDSIALQDANSASEDAAKPEEILHVVKKASSLMKAALAFIPAGKENENDIEENAAVQGYLDVELMEMKKRLLRIGERAQVHDAEAAEEEWEA